MRIVGVLLAAGSGTRFGSDKLVAAMLDGEAMGVRTCRTLVEALPETIAVVREGDAALTALLATSGARVVECASASQGMGHSLACGVRASADADGWVIALADMPWILSSTFSSVANALREGAPLAAARFRGARGNPVGFSRSYGEALMGLQGDRGARDLVAAAGATLVGVDIDDESVLRDVDRPDDLRAQ